jgi:hypothetical protein
MKNFSASCSYFDRWVALTKLGSRVFVFLNLLYLVLLRLPWDAGEAGKADACAGCPNQQICSTAPKGPDPSNWIMHFLVLNSIPFYDLLWYWFTVIFINHHIILFDQ